MKTGNTEREARAVTTVGVAAYPAARPTLQSVADLAGVSKPTVSRILNGRHRDIHISDELAANVRALAARVGYRANTAARATSLGRYQSLALLLSTQQARSHLPCALLDGILAAAHAADWHISVAALPDTDLTDPARVPRLLRLCASDGLLINYNAAIPERMIELIRGGGVPAVWINSRQPTDCVYLDDYGAARELTRRLLDLGHRRIAYADYGTAATRPHWHYSGRDRWQGYADELTAAGLRPRRLGGTETAIGHAQRPAFNAAWLRSDERPSAVVGYTSQEAVSILHDALRLGVNVPGMLSVATFHDAPLTVLGPAVSGMLLPEAEVGRRAVELLLNHVRDGKCPRHPPVAVPMSFLAGETIGPPERPASV